MNIKEYLLQAQTLDKRIDSNLSQITSLEELNQKAKNILERKNIETLKEISEKISFLEEELTKDMKEILVLKEEIIKLINSVENPEQRILLQLRYLCFKQWEEVADTMGYSVQNAYRIHDKALISMDNFRLDI